MANYNQAPKLHHSVDKEDIVAACGNNFYMIPQLLGDIINHKLANSSAQMRIMYVLIGTKEGFGLSEQWMLDRTGLTHSRYIEARNNLKKRGWLIHKEGSITINYAAILAEKDDV